jgi:flagellar L-ring protein precursor FlgH
MKARQYFILMVMAVVMASLSACSHTVKDVDFSEDELSMPMGDQGDNIQSPGSLWSPSAKYYDMFSDHKARQVGDLVIVQVIESSSADKEATTEASRSNSVDSSVTNFLGIPLNKTSVLGAKLEPTVKLDGSSKFSGDGKTTRKGTLSATVSARLIRILPSGNYVIKGKKQIRVNDESQYITVSGIIRPEDIMWNNSVMSTNIADLKVDYYGSGILGDQQSKGLFARALDKIWPF